MVVHRMMPAPDDSEIWPRELHAFLTSEALVTVHSTPIGEVDRIFDRCAAEPGLLGRGPDFALYMVFDAMADVHFALVDALSAEVEELADEVLARERPAGGEDLLDRIILARRRQSVLRKRLAPQREVFATLARPGLPMVKRQTAVYFRDVVDHAVRLTEEVDTERDLLASAQDAHLSHVNNRLSTVMARLTLISTIFLPLNFMAGFFGMNLEILPQRVAVPAVSISMAALPRPLYLFFRKRAGCSAPPSPCGSGTSSPVAPGGRTRTSPSSPTLPSTAISTSRKRRITSALVSRCGRHLAHRVADGRRHAGRARGVPGHRQGGRQEQLVAQLAVHRRAARQVAAEGPATAWSAASSGERSRVVTAPCPVRVRSKVETMSTWPPLELRAGIGTRSASAAMPCSRSRRSASAACRSATS